MSVINRAARSPPATLPTKSQFLRPSATCFINCSVALLSIGKRDEVLPMTPDFAQWLLQTLEVEQVGLVFKLPVPTGRQMTRNWAGRVVGQIGEKAKVVVNKEAGKHATAHDLRRAFGTRWAKRVMPAVLQRLMRHANIQTTMAYYVGLSADDVADQLWATFAPVGNISGNIGPAEGEQQEAATERKRLAAQ